MYKRSSNDQKSKNSHRGQKGQRRQSGPNESAAADKSVRPLKNELREKISIKPSTLLAPVPAVLIGCCGKPDGQRPQKNLITVAWAGTICSDPPMLSIAIRKERWSHQQIKETREFTVNLVDKSLLWAADFCGVKSGQDVDKFKECKLTAIPAEALPLAPAVAQSPLTLSCRLSQIIELGSHDLFLAKIVAVQVDPKIMKGQKICLDQAELTAFAHGEYYAIGEILGFFGYSIASSDVLYRRLPKTAADNITGSKERRKIRSFAAESAPDELKPKPKARAGSRGGRTDSETSSGYEKATGSGKGRRGGSFKR